MRISVLIIALVLLTAMASPLSAQTTMITFDGINLTTGSLGAWYPPAMTQPNLTNGRRLIAAHPIISRFGGESHTQFCYSGTFPANGELSISNAGSNRRPDRRLFFENPRDFIEFGPFPYGLNGSFIFTMYGIGGGAHGTMRVTTLDANKNPYPGTILGAPFFYPDSSGQFFDVGSTGSTTAFYNSTVPNGGYVRLTRSSLYGGTSNCNRPSGNFEIDNISFEPNALPVELTSFRCSVLDDVVRLNWTTSTELNNYGFKIERSTDRDSWKEIGFVAGFGTTFSPKKYEYLDGTPDWSSGAVFYRLHQIDRDGTSDYSAIVRADRASATPASLLLNTFPQPFDNSLQVQIGAKEEEYMSVKLYNNLLQDVATLHDGPVQGIMTLSYPTADLMDGNYFLVVRAGAEAPVVKKIIKMTNR
ncbi:MAG: hypothetical protein IH600_00495 [Bacteroidetes bacterium]|nr:hypothetical protein [Bacteroidota bacterium]